MTGTPKPLAGSRIVTYVRVSTEAQLDGLGLDVQRAAVESLTKRHGGRIVAHCSDEGVTGTDTLDRDGLACAVGAIAEGEADVLVIPSLSRLARRLDIQEAVLALVWSHGGRVFSVDEGEISADDSDNPDPMRSFARKLFGLIHELEAATIAQRLRKGREAKAQRGGYAGGRPRFGHRSEGRELVPDAREAAALDRMRSLRAGGASLRSIAATLNAEGVPTKSGGRWHPTTVNRLLNEAARSADAAAARRRREHHAREKRRRETARAAAAAGLATTRP